MLPVGILPWLALSPVLGEIRQAREDIGKTVANFSMHVRARGRSPSQMPVYRSQRGLKITSSSIRTLVTPDSRQEKGREDQMMPARKRHYRQPLSLQGKHALVQEHKCKYTHRVTHTRRDDAIDKCCH